MTDQQRVVVTTSYSEDVLSDLRRFASVEVHSDPYNPKPRGEVISDLSNVCAVINQGELQVDEQFLSSAPQLRIVANASVGFDKLDVERMASYGVWATNVPDVYHEPVAEYVFATVGTLFRRIRDAEDYVKSGNWSSFEPGRWDGASLSGKTIGIVGFGMAGQRVARIAEGYGMNVLLNSRSRTGDSRYRDLIELASAVDILSLHVPAKEDTYHLIDMEVLNAMKPSAYLVNVARGSVVDQEALLRVLTEGRIAGAVLDVFEKEPEVPEELRRMPNVLVTPHIAGGTVEARTRAQSVAVSNVVAVLSGNEPRTPVNAPRQRLENNRGANK